MRRSFSFSSAALMLLASLPMAAGDVFVLRSGGRVEGDLLNSDEKPRTSYVISLPGGGQVTLDAAVVAKVEPVRPELAEYEKVRRKYPDTVQGQLQMSDWCRDHNLPAQRNKHLERVLQLDTDQPDARRLLNYRKVKDKWMTLEEEMADQGKVKRIVNGSAQWLTLEEAEIRDRHETENKAEKEWMVKIYRWQKWLGGSRADLAAEAEKRLRAIDDRMAIVGLAERLLKKPDPRTEVRLIFVDALANIHRKEALENKNEALGTLCACAIDDPVEEVRLTCLDELQKYKNDSVTAYFTARMRDNKNKKENKIEVINRAGVALGRMKDPSSITTLIEYLVTIHTETLPPPGGPGSMTNTFSKTGGGGIGMNQKPIVVKRRSENAGVLEGLESITGQNFGYDQRAWLTWYQTQKAKGLSGVAARKL